MDLKNAKILITGGSLGIGKATAKKILAEIKSCAVVAIEGE